MRLVILMGMVLFVGLGCSQIKEKNITEVARTELDTILLVDVRTPKEYNEGHLDNAVNIDWMDDGFVSGFEKIDKDKTIYLYCRSGRRSASAAKYLDSLGYSEVYNLKGGYMAYENARK
ncbi:rhodanese-like domain-containing protein [Maribacter sp. TH_r10]|uniref:rhodanese-like domain-containing protein n=1 Tax=Maribacter sp. TH_r10 TaxID=3082086 RepID=UPI002955497B|nr:rhodanese-like domain-containing protein [Maribacter sp. TH_r10]MDV7140247.1 rhodanese-like domain-containing protein [Maribacter sp. TH_r10]